LLYLLADMKTGTFEQHNSVLAMLVVICSLPIYSAIHVYDRRVGYLAVVRRLTFAWVVLLGLLMFMAFVTKTGSLYSREVVLKWGTLGYLAQCLMFVPLHALSCSYHRHRQQNQRALIVGSGDLAQLLAEQLSKSPNEALVGLVHHNDNPPDPSSLFPTIGGIVQLRNLISQHDVQKIYIALPADEMGNIDALYVDLMDINVDVLWVPDTTSMLLLNHSVSEVAGIPVIHLNESPLTANPSAALLKSALDRVLALLAIVVLSPLMLALAVAVKLSSPGPVLFAQPRHGWNGRVFQM